MAGRPGSNALDGPMASPTDVFLLFLMVFPLMFSPGPSNLLCAASGGKFGIARSVPFVIGMDLMVFVPALAVGLGMAELVGRVPGIFRYVQIGGAIFIVYLAWRILGANTLERRDVDGPAPGIVEGMVVQAGNAKGLALLLVIYSQFLHPGRPVWLAALEISLALTVFSLISHFSWLTAGAWLAARFTSPRAMKIQNAVYATLLVGVAAWLLLMEWRPA